MSVSHNLRDLQDVMFGTSWLYDERILVDGAQLISKLHGTDGIGLCNNSSRKESLLCKM